MSTCRQVVAGALRALKALAIGDDPEADELDVGLAELQALTLELTAAMGPLVDVDVTATTWIPAENQRLRVQLGDTATITLPNSVPFLSTPDPYDYGFALSMTAAPPQGSTASADGITTRAPRDAARIEIVGVTQALYMFRADLNAWMAATGLTLDVEIPFNARYADAITALLAERLANLVGGEVTPTLLRRTARARETLMLRASTPREPAMGQYL